MAWIWAFERVFPSGMLLLTTADLIDAAAFLIWSKVTNGPGPLLLPLPWHPLIAQLFWIMGFTSVENLAGTEAQDAGGGGGAGGGGSPPLPPGPLLHAPITVISDIMTIT
jgi:hypothetical protein